jgi:hypothetical protein
MRYRSIFINLAKNEVKRIIIYKSEGEFSIIGCVPLEGKKPFKFKNIRNNIDTNSRVVKL